ncbi:MAG: hypothetical protein ACQEP9_10160, partial [Bacillota bacterium]
MLNLLKLVYIYFQRIVITSLIDLIVLLGPLIFLSLVMNFISIRLNKGLLTIVGREIYLKFLARPGVF